MDISVVVPLYNEEESIPLLMTVHGKLLIPHILIQMNMKK